MKHFGKPSNPRVTNFIEHLIEPGEDGQLVREQLAQAAMRLMAETKKPLSPQQATQSVEAALRNLSKADDWGVERPRPDLAKAPAALKRVVSLARAASRGEQFDESLIPTSKDLQPFLEVNRRRELWKKQ